MPRQKRKTPKLEITVTAAVIIEAPARIEIRCVWDGRLIIGGDKTPSGTRYVFNTGEVQPVFSQDYQSLLEMETKPFGCCGGTVKPQKYFEAVEV